MWNNPFSLPGRLCRVWSYEPQMGWAGPGLTTSSLQGPEKQGSFPRTQKALLRASMLHGCFCGVSAFFFFLTFNREVLSRHTLVLISALMKPAQAVFPWHLPEILWGQLHSLPLIILTIFRANCQGTYSIPSFYVFNSFSLPISIYIEVFFFFLRDTVIILPMIKLGQVMKL